MSEASWIPVLSEVTALTADVALQFFHGALDVETKPDGSPVTVADRAAEQAARDWIVSRFPDDAIVGEELGADRVQARRRWLIDPIDGTKTFLRGVSLWGSMIAVEEDGRVVAGAICCPATGDLVVAADGEGCWWNGKRASVSTRVTLADATILTTDATFAHHPERALRWSALATQVAVSRTWGDCYGYVLVATGRAEAMADDRLNPWDVAPLIPILREAGGLFSDWQGRLWHAGDDGLATNAILAARIRSALGVPAGRSV
ncbi:MAG: inositol monophosphatase family protein [Gemmatimonadaceae bacterium]